MPFLPKLFTIFARTNVATLRCGQMMLTNFHHFNLWGNHRHEVKRKMRNFKTIVPPTCPYLLNSMTITILWKYDGMYIEKIYYFSNLLFICCWIRSFLLALRSEIDIRNFLLNFLSYKNEHESCRVKIKFYIKLETFSSDC